MAAVHISETEAVDHFDRLLAHVQAGGEIIVDRGPLPIAVLSAPAPRARTIEECLQMLPDDPTSLLDEDFAQDVQEAVAFHRESLNPPAWD